jgi:ribosomal protein S4
MNKFKNLSKNVSFIGGIPFVKIFNFKRSKWKFLKSFLRRKTYLKKPKFFNFVKVRAKKGGKWKKLIKAYKAGLNLKTSLSFFFGDAISRPFLKKFLLAKNISLATLFLFQPLLKLDTFLWKFNLFPSVRSVKQYIFLKKIKVNNVVVKNALFLKKGDIIFVEGLGSLVKRNFFLKNFYLSFCEIDFYSNCIIILKDVKNLSVKDICHLFRENIELKKLLYYIKKM